MTTTTEVRWNAQQPEGLARLAGPMFVLGGIAFFIGGVTHPGDSGTGNKVQQLHNALVDPSWYRSHAVLLAANALFAAGILALRRRDDLRADMERLLKAVFVIACIATVAMAVHLFAALDADSLADGEHGVVSILQTANEAIVGTAWGLALATLAVVGGLTRSLGNRMTMPFGLVGGLAFALASATIAYIDTFDPLFKVASLLSVWAIVAGGMAIRQRR